MSVEPERAPRLPPRWFIRAFWVGHRAAYAVSRGHFGLRRAKADRWGMLRLRTVGRRSGQERSAILGYLDDGPDLLLVAMKGWADPEPAWWLNLRANPDTSVDLAGESRTVRARVANEDERTRHLASRTAVQKDRDAYAALRSRETQLIILEPRSESAA